jgi:hypothetical protein
VLAAALLYLSDSSPEPADLRLQGMRVGAQQVQVRITLTPAERTSQPDQTADYRPLQWADVCALARAEAVELQQGPDGITLQLAARA